MSVWVLLVQCLFCTQNNFFQSEYPYLGFQNKFYHPRQQYQYFSQMSNFLLANSVLSCIESWDHRRVGRDIKGHLVPTFLQLEEHLPLGQVAQRLIQSGLEQFQWCAYSHHWEDKHCHSKCSPILLHSPSFSCWLWYHMVWGISFTTWISCPGSIHFLFLLHPQWFQNETNYIDLSFHLFVFVSL